MVAPVVDSQVHIAPPGAGRWRRDDRSTRGHGFLPDADTLLREMDRAGVDAAVLVPPLAAGKAADNSWCLAAARAHPDRFAVMGRFRPEAADATAALDGWLDQPGMLGIRLSFARGGGPGDDGLDRFFARAAADGIPLMVNAGGRADALLPVARRHPELRLVVDHLGLEGRIAAADLQAALAPVLALADCANVAVKASALPVFVDEAFPFPSLQAAVGTAVRAFGAERVFWGSDLSRLPCDYGEVVALFRDRLDFLPARARALVLGEGLLGWLNWAPGRA